MSKHVPTEASRLGYLDVNVYMNGKTSAEVRYTRTEVEFVANPLQGTAQIKPIQMGSCTSEIPYYMGKGEKPPRFLQDSTNESKLHPYLDRTEGDGYTSGQDSIKHMQVHSPFHEGCAEVQAFEPDQNRTDIPILVYEPELVHGTTQLKRTIRRTNFQNGIQEGGLVALNPAKVCDEHSSADNIDPATGWPHQCDRSLHMNPKATRGHTEAPGTAIQGIHLASLDSLTPIPPELSAYIEKDRKSRAILGTSIEPLACVFQAHGKLLETQKIPKNIAVIGDGVNSLLMMMFYQAFAPEADIVVAGKSREKLEVISQVNPRRIRTVITRGESAAHGYDDLAYALEELTGAAQADIVIPTVNLPKDVLDPFVRPDGSLIWWAAQVSENVPVGQKHNGKYNEVYSYGGAPRAEFSAAAILDHFAKYQPEILAPLTVYPGIFTTDMGPQAAKAVQTWLNNKGKFIHPDNGLSSKIVVNME